MRLYKNSPVFISLKRCYKFFRIQYPQLLRPESKKYVYCRVEDRDPVLFDPWIRDGKKSEPGYGMHIPDLIFEIFLPVFGLKILNLWCGSISGILSTLDPGSGMEKYWIRDKHPGYDKLVNWELIKGICSRTKNKSVPEFVSRAKMIPFNKNIR